MNLIDDEPRVLVIYYNENGDYASENNDIKEQIIDKIDPFNQRNITQQCDFIFLCTQKSLSSTSDHMQHVIGEELKKPGSQYTLFSKIDATRPSNSSAWRISKDLKFKNVRVRCWRNINIKKPLKTEENNLEKKSYRCKNNSFINEYNYTNSSKTNVSSPDIKIKEYKYKRITEIDESKRKNGFGGIIVSLILEKEGKEYKYIICNYNLETNISKLINPQQTNKDNQKNNISKILNNQKNNVDNLYISVISQKNIISKYIEKNKLIDIPSINNIISNNNPIYSIELSKYIRLYDLIVLLHLLFVKKQININFINNFNIIKGLGSNFDYIYKNLNHYFYKISKNDRYYDTINYYMRYFNSLLKKNI
jgi:hypothetical protein